MIIGHHFLECLVIHRTVFRLCIFRLNCALCLLHGMRAQRRTPPVPILSFVLCYVEFILAGLGPVWAYMQYDLQAEGSG